MKPSDAQQSGLSEAAEIARFNALAKSWWDPNGPMKPLHRLGPSRLAYLKRELATHFGRDGRAMRPFEGLSLLDIGCGGGLVSEPLARMGFAVTGLDLAEENITVARAHAAEAGLAIDYRTTPIEDMPPEPTFDAVTLLEVVEHVPDVPAFVAEAAKRLKPGGMLIASTINRTAKAWALAIVGAEYVLGWLPRGTHDYDKFVTPDELADAMESAGLEPGSAVGLAYSPLSASWSLSPDTDVNYFLAAVKGG